MCWVSIWTALFGSDGRLSRNEPARLGFSTEGRDQKYGKKNVTGEDVRRGFETLQITEARWKELGLEGFAGPLKVTCGDHNGHHSAYMQQWDGAKWVKVTDWITPMKDKVRPLLEAASKDYVSKNQPWPNRTESTQTSSTSSR